MTADTIDCLMDILPGAMSKISAGTQSNPVNLDRVPDGWEIILEGEACPEGRDKVYAVIDGKHYRLSKPKL